MGRGELLQLSGKITHNLWIFLLFPQFARQTKQNAGCMRGEFCVNVSRFSAPLVGSYGESCVAEKTKRRRDKKSKGQRDEETKSRRGKGTKRGRDEGTRRRKPRHLLFTSYSPPIHLLFTSYSCPLHLLFTSQFVQFLFNSCPKTFVRFVSKTVLHQGTPFRERSVKVT